MGLEMTCLLTPPVQHMQQRPKMYRRHLMVPEPMDPIMVIWPVLPQHPRLQIWVQILLRQRAPQIPSRYFLGLGSSLPLQLGSCPRAPPRKMTNRRGKQRGHTANTDRHTREKCIGCSQFSEENQTQETRKRQSWSEQQREGETNIQADPQQTWYCLVCDEKYADSQPGEKWVRCSGCFDWAHDACTEGHDTYICHNCSEPSDQHGTTFQGA
ncbi:putative jerky protein-like-like [Apostichopus japonicus]|uniref:Putative jerky protein-like-like n=1 Tax=Stichopus japonicus TaxID=307972 RepID=A0A2G8JU57_STIJA|nr:putative jerky protein-like-like [Apostichopus japonicus]